MNILDFPSSLRRFENQWGGDFIGFFFIEVLCTLTIFLIVICRWPC